MSALSILSRFSVSLIIFLASMLAGCGGGGGGGAPPPDTTPPNVISVSPPNGATGVAVNDSVSATFSEAMSPSTISTTTFSLKDAANNPVNGIVVYAGTTATFIPSGTLAFSTAYTAAITTGAKDLAGNPMSGVYYWTFTTGVAPDTTPPTVMSTTPANGATGVSVNTTVSATFSEAMSPSTIDKTTFIVKDSASNAVSGVVDYSNNTATFTPNAKLSFSTAYTATITTGAKDLAGNALTSNYAWPFTTEAAATLTVNKLGTGGGTVTSSLAGINCGSDCTATYANGTGVTLTATPQANSIFDGFSGGCSSVRPTCTLTFTGDATVTAIFNTASASAAGNQVGLNGVDNVAVHQLANNPPSSVLDLTTFTIEAWVFPLANQDMLIAADSAYYLMVRAPTATRPLGVEFAVMTSSGFPVFQFFAGNLQPMKLNQWNHVVGMVDNYTKTLVVGINGELTGSLTFSGDVNTTFPQTFSVGNSYPTGLGNFPFIGRIDEIRLSSMIRYSATFTPSSLLDPDGATVGLWHFDEAAGATSFADASGNGNTLTGLNGAATIAGNRNFQASVNSLFYSLNRLDLTSITTVGPVAIGDFNNDGKNDLATAGMYSIANDKVTILLGSGGGSFAPATLYSDGASGSHSSIAIADFNKDGNMDLAVANWAAGNISILLGDGTGGFGTGVTFPTGAAPNSIAVGDFNSDGILDLAVANSGSNTVSILLGTGTGSFVAATNIVVGIGPSSVASGDFNGDGKLDLAIANSGGNTVSVLLGTGTGSFGAATDFVVGNGPRSLKIGDFNNDGRLDIVTANFNSGNVSILLGNGAGFFASASNFTVGFGGPSYLAIGDLNGDGVLDVAVASGGGNMAFAVLLGDGSGSFGSPIPYSTESNPLSVAIGDLTGDGKPDLAVGVSFSKIDITVAR